MDKPLKEHNLLQAIARVNRLSERKDYGYIIDYRGLIKELDEAMMIYSGAGLEEFDPEDIKEVLYDVTKVLGDIEEHRSHILEMFSEIKNKHDIEEYEVLLADEELRKSFYEHLSKLGRNLTYAVESEEIYRAIGVEKLKRYKKEFRFFQELRRNVKIRYFEAIDLREYELKMQKLMDNYIASEEIIRITNPVDITDEDAFSKELERLSSPRAQAEAIQTRLSKAISKQMSRNPAYYKKFSVRIQETIDMYRKHRITEVEFLAQMKQVLHDYREGNSGIEYPERITDNDHAKAFYGELDDLFSEVQFPDSIDKYQLTNDIAELAIETEEIINTNVKVDWTDNPEIHKKIEQKLDDMLYDFFDKHDIEINFEMIDKMIESLKMIALRRFNK